MKSVCVFCASSELVDKVYMENAFSVGKLLACNGMRCIYGAGKVGLMGELADAVLENGGKIVGVIPQRMVEMRLNHTSLTQMIVTPGMSVRKETMLELADTVLALPGGVGTLEELVDAISWKRLGIIKHNILIFNQNGFFNPLLQMFRKAIDEHFMCEEDRNCWTVVENLEQLQKILKK